MSSELPDADSVKPLVTLCQATCGRPQFFAGSFQSLLRQSYRPLEIVVLADGADPDTLRILESCNDRRLRWFSTPRPSGMVPAWNRVCREARGKYLLFCADDDLLMPQAIDAQVDLLERDPGMVFCHADYVYIDDDGKEIGSSISHRGTFIDSGLKSWPKFLVATSCCMQTTVMRRSAWEQVGGWDDDAGNPGDNSLYLKLLPLGDVGHVGRITCQYRLRIRSPDSWEKLFGNLRDYEALASKYLATVPTGVGVAPAVLRRRVMARLAKSSVNLVVTAPSHAAAAELVRWLESHIWPGSAVGRACALMARAHLLGWADRAFQIQGVGRQAAKWVARRAWLGSPK
jgi:glycosyltransferase involved in cell wall biosynthesis